MKKSILSLAMATSMLMAAPATFAADGTLTFNGEITAATCTVTGGDGATGAGTIAVELRKYAATAFAGPSSVVGATPFTLELGGGADCTEGKTFTMDFLGGGASAATNGNLGNAAGQGGAKNVQVQVLNAAGQPINFKTGANAPSSGTITGNQGQIQMTAQYFAESGAVEAGPVTTSVEFVLSHN